MIIRPLTTRVFKEGEDLFAFIVSYIPKLKNKSVIVITSKIVALSEKRTSTNTGRRAKIRLIKSESQWAMRTKWTWLTIKDNAVMSAAGIDESNANGKLILLPKDSFKAAAVLRQKLKRFYKVNQLGILITDSRLLPLRAGVVGIALGYAGFKGVRDDRGTKDIFGRKLKLTRVDIADAVATAAVLTMGEAAEKRPLAIVEDSPAVFTETVKKNELIMDFRDDVFAPLFKKVQHIKLKKIKNPH